jgi:hypothetical protein
MTDDSPKDGEAATDAEAAGIGGAAATEAEAASVGGAAATGRSQAANGGKTSPRGGTTARGRAKMAAAAEAPRASALSATDGPETGTDGQAPPPLNREQRRAQKFHRKSGGRQDNLQTQRENNSGFLTTPPALIEEGPKEAVATSTTQGPTHLTGPGTGGATETEERAPHHEGAHQGNPTKG